MGRWELGFVVHGHTDSMYRQNRCSLHNGYVLDRIAYMRLQWSVRELVCLGVLMQHRCLLGGLHIFSISE